MLHGDFSTDPHAILDPTMAKGPRLPAPRQRRLDQLLHKGQDGSLTKKESAELEGMLDEIDRNSFWVLARVLARVQPDLGERAVAAIRCATLQARVPAAGSRRQRCSLLLVRLGREGIRRGYSVRPRAIPSG